MSVQISSASLNSLAMQIVQSLGVTPSSLSQAQYDHVKQIITQVAGYAQDTNDLISQATLLIKAYLATPKPTPLPTWTLAKSQALWPWLWPQNGGPLFAGTPTGNISQHYSPTGQGNGSDTAIENGIDLEMHLHTQITSLTAGTVVTTGFFGGGGVVCVHANIPFQGIGQAIVYYQHLDTISVKKGQTVYLGTEIGLSGGQLSGGVHPVTCCSSGPHIEVGINPPPNGDPLWVSLGPSVDPLPWLQALVVKGPSVKDRLASTSGAVGAIVGTATAIEQAAQGTGQAVNSFLDVEMHLNAAMAMVPFRSSKGDLPNPVADWPLVGGAVSLVEAPFNGALNVAGWFGGIVDWLINNTVPMLIRTFFVLTGLLILTAFVFAMFKSAYKASGTEAAVEQGTKTAATVAAVA